MHLAAEIIPEKWISLSEEEFNPEIAEFNERVRDLENPFIIAKTLRKAASLITERLPKRIATAEGFVAFAIDWEVQGDDLAKILKQWKQQGWI